MSGRRPPRRTRIALIAAIAIGVLACQGGIPGDSPGGPTEVPRVSPTVSVPAPTAAPTADPQTPAPLAVDAGLLDVLPQTAGKVAIEPDPENAARLIGDPTLGSTASGIAVARYASGDEIMVVSVMHLRPGVFSEGFFDTWRQEYDGSACEPAGGTTGAGSVQTIGTHVVHIGTCAGGATTYHTALEGDVLVSAIVVGTGPLGQDVMAGLRP